MKEASQIRVTVRNGSADHPVSHSGDEGEGTASRVGRWFPIVVLMSLASILRLYHLDAQLWHDEISVVTNSLSRSLLEIATEWPGPASHLLFELSARLSAGLLGFTPVGIRLPAAIFGIAGVAALYWLASLLFERSEAYAISALYAVSYFHVWFSQNARGYTAMMLFFVVVTAQVIRFWRSGRIPWQSAAAYALAGAALGYSQPAGIAVLPVQAAIVLVATRLGPGGRIGVFPLRRYLVAAGAGILLTLLLYLPLIGSIMDFAASVVAAPDSGARTVAEILNVLADDLGRAFLGAVGIGVAGVVGIVGLVRMVKNEPFALAQLALPVIAQAVTFLFLGLGLNPRYLAIALPVLFIVGGAGLIGILQAVTERVVAERRRRAVVFGSAMVVAAVSALPLVSYYRFPKQDYLGAVALVDRNARPEDVRGAVYIAANAINGYYGAGYERVDGLADLQRLEAAGHDVWLVTTLERVLAAGEPELYEHIQRHYVRRQILPGTLGDGAMRIYHRDADGPVELPQAAADAAPIRSDDSAFNVSASSVIRQPLAALR